MAQVGASRWRGLPGAADRLALAHDRRQHRHQRLQLLRHALDRQPGGRWAALAPDTAAIAVGAVPLPVLVRRLFLWLDGRRVDSLLVQRFPGAAADLALDPAPCLPAAWRACQPDTPATDAAHALRLAWDWHARLRLGRPADRTGRVGSALAPPARLLQVQPATARAAATVRRLEAMARPVTATVVPTGPAAGRPVTLPPCRRSPASPVRPAVTAPPRPLAMAHRARPMR